MAKLLRTQFCNNSLILKACFILLLNLACIFTLQAQTVTIGTGDDEPGDDNLTHQPFGNFYSYERSAGIYLGTEIGTSGTITAIGWFLEATNSPAASVPAEIYFKNTANTTFTGNEFAPNELSGATLVWSGNITSGQLIPGTWITITLSTPFVYNTASNLEVITATNTSNISGGFPTRLESNANAKDFRVTNVGATRFLFWQRDDMPPGTNDPGDPNGPLDFPFSSTYRPNIQLTFSGAPSTCDAPTSLSASNITSTSADLNFTPSATGASGTYTVEYGPSGFTPGTGTVVTGVTSSPYNATGLSPSTAYQFYVTKNCSGGNSTTAGPASFSTTAAPATCDAPTSLSASNITSTSADLNFTPSATGASGTYTVEYGPSGFTPGTGTVVTGVTSSPYNATGLSPSTAYQFYVTKNCSGGNSTTAGPASFSTTAAPATCDAPTSLSASNITSSSADLNFTPSATGASGTYTIEYGPSGFTPGTGTIVTGVTSSPYNATGLSPSTAYQFYVTKNCSGGNSTTAGPASFSTTAAPATCDAPTSLSASNITSTSADLNFTPSATGASGTYTVEYGPSGFTPGTGTIVTGVTSSPYNATGLSPSTAYQFYVTKNCSGGNSTTAGPASFSTTAAPVVCNDPTNLSATNITNTTADLAFSPSSGTGTYTVEYGLNGFTPGTGTTVNVSSSPASVSGLSANTTYQFYVTKNCGSGVFSSQVGPASFTTTNVAPAVCDAPTNLSASNITNTSADLNFTPSASGASGTYTVEYGVSGFTPGTGTVVTGVTSSPYNATGLMPGVTYDFYVTKNCSGGNSTSAGPASFTTTIICSTGTWTGITSTDWNTASNWCNNTIPDINTNVTIPALTLFQPQITSNANARNLTIQSGATLTLTSGILTVSGLYTNNGTLVSNGNGSLEFTSSNTNLQSVGKPGTTTIFQNLTSGSGGISLGGPVSIKELLTLNGNLSTNGQTFTLLSEPSNQAMVVNNGGTVIGTATVQRYINPGINSGPGYRHFSSPVSNAVIGDLNDAGVNMVVNPAYNSNPTPGTTRPFPTVFGYNETRLTTTNPDFTFGWESPSSLSDPMTPGKGFTVNTLPTTVDLAGTLNNGNISAGTLTRGSTAKSGWHLLGNPYPAPIDWDLVTLPSGVDNAVYVFRSTGQYAGSYTSYVNGVGTPGTELIAVMQAFFVRVNSGSPTFTFSNSARVTTYQSPAFYRQSIHETRPLISLSVQDNTGKGDQLYVYFQHGATANFDSEYDAFKLPNSGNVTSFYSLAGNDILSINGLPRNIPGTVIPLGGRVPQAGTYSISADQILNFKLNQDIFLEDRTTGTLHNLRQQSSYTFSTNQTDLTGRFFLRFSPATTTGITAPDLASEVLVYPNPNNGVFTISMPAFNNAITEAKLYNTVGQKVWQQSLKADSKQHIQQTIRLDKLAAGVYTLRLETGAGPVNRKIVIE